MANIAVAVGVPAARFEVLNHFDEPAYGAAVCATAGAVRGDLVYWTGQDEVTQAATGVGANVQYVGFLDTNVVDDMATRRVDVFGDYAQVDEDKVSVWKRGRFLITNVSGTVGDNVLVYPTAAGGLSATQTGSDKAVGYCRKGNGGVAGKPIEVEIDFV